MPRTAQSRPDVGNEPSQRHRLISVAREHREAPRLVVFDCDGVLVDSERIAVDIDQTVLETVGLSLSRQEIIDRFVGRSPSVIYGVIEESLGYPIPPEMRAEFGRRYEEAFDAELTPVPGITDALDRIRLPICVASSSEPQSLRHKLALTGLSPYFGDHIFSASQVARGKPAPDLFLFAASQMGYRPSESIVVEDSQYGVEAALAAGMMVLAFAGGVTPTQSLRRDGVTVFDDMRELPALLGT